MDGAYNSNVEAFREAEYPMLRDAIYLDHAGTALYSKSLIERFTADMLSNLYGNPHSASVSSQLSTNRIEDTRLKALRFFNADPEEFDLIFVANATAGIKLVADAFRNVNHGFNYIYHKDAHTSLVGVRELAKTSRCLDDGEIEEWLSSEEQSMSEQDMFNLFAYPAQSNMDGRRLPISWLHRARSIKPPAQSTTYTLLDASALVSTSPLDLSNPDMAADFTVLSFYKIFGFPDLGGLIIRKDAGAVFKHRGYFGGGTVDIVLCIKEQWHVSKTETLHESLEDGTLPTHQIIALDVAIDVHRELYGSMMSISRHANFLAKRLYDGLSSIRHFNLKNVCLLHSSGFSHANSAHIQGPTIAFNLKNSHGAWVSNTEFERLASVRGFHIRSGGLCNPGGIATCLKLEPWEMKENFSAGVRCGAESMVHSGKVTGVLRASVGAMSTIKDVDAFISFVQEFYAEKDAFNTVAFPPLNSTSQLLVESLMIYPIKSCGGLKIPPNTDWELRPEGLVWDREWCLVHQGTGQALSQKRHPRMALIRPEIDVETGVLHVKYHGTRPLGVPENISIPLSADPTFFGLSDGNKPIQSRVCGDPIVAKTYAKPEINDYFSSILGVPCTLARFPAGGSGRSTRHAKAHMQKHQRPERTSTKGNQESEPYDSLPTPPDSDNEVPIRPILLSNESPILAINRASLDALNRRIVETGGKPASSSVFRANIVIGSSSDTRAEKPYDEDHWTTLHIGRQRFQMLGSCRRCHMICVDQDTADKNEEPFLSLAKTRRFDSKIFFGSHMCHVPSRGSSESQFPTIRVGDIVTLGVGDD